MCVVCGVDGVGKTEYVRLGDEDGGEREKREKTLQVRDRKMRELEEVDNGKLQSEGEGEREVGRERGREKNIMSEKKRAAVEGGRE